MSSWDQANQASLEIHPGRPIAEALNAATPTPAIWGTGSFAWFDEVCARITAECEDTAKQGRKEYAHDEGNVFANFERTGADLDLPRERVLWIFLKKHLDGILAHINGHTSQREDVRGRIKDAINYLKILWAMEEEGSAPF